jgi:hypothetical protein
VACSAYKGGGTVPWDLGIKEFHRSPIKRRLQDEHGRRGPLKREGVSIPVTAPIVYPMCTVPAFYPISPAPRRPWLQCLTSRFGKAVTASRKACFASRKSRVRVRSSPPKNVLVRVVNRSDVAGNMR